ncbi:GNAT family N-acetyltransferase [Staphylococcus chromogenes]|uniref:GNAT family N-acetyltransferase n=1 Tax=Staphylococcus chromogenes TaxID=46126 RepID=UPI00118AC194|nr:GNAT family N-acetyltransferase [Staphylococcus chromogenes]QDW92001.1 GNAT family N-acetyltransferase [Staphylococcus chromogenes]
MIREAKEADAQSIAELSYMIWKDMELEIVRKHPKEEVIQAIQHSVTDIPYRNHYRHVHVYEVDSQVAGMIVTYEGNKELQYEQSWRTLTCAKAFPLSTETPLPVKEADDGDIYIESIATFPAFRGRGIAKALMQHVMSHYKDQKLSLNCDQTNTVARRIYEQMGFQPTNKKTLYGHTYHYMTYQS